MVANASAYLNISGELFIQMAISAALMSLAENDKVLSCILARSGGADWDDLEKVTP
jgi:chromosome condensin MukBEF MukE localization factor